MKQIISKKLWIAAIALFAVPASLLAQKEEKDKKDVKKQTEQIIITRSADDDAKTIIEIDGKNIKVNGKNIEDVKDGSVKVHRNKWSTPQGYSTYNRNGNYNMDFDLDHNISLFNEDANRAMLGVTTEEHDKGAEIKSVTKESAAEKAGLKKGDVLTKIGNKKIEETGDVTEAIHDQKPGDKISVTYLRDGKEQQATAELGKWKGIKMNAVAMPKLPSREQWELASPRDGYFYSFGGKPKLGLAIQDTDDGKGVKVLEVDEESNAAKAGLKEGDIITEVDGNETNSADAVTKIVKGDGKEKTSWSFKVQRDGKTQTIEVKIPRRLKTADL